MTRRGFTLTEMLFILGMLAVAGLLTTRLFTASMRVIDQAPAARDRQTSIEHISMALRRDVWSASAIQLPDSRTIVLANPDGQTTRWTVDEHGIIRSSGGAERRWPVAMPLWFESIEAGVALRGPGAAEGRRFISQILVAERSRP
jgi:type II secretory pathway pseudopilin PulG